MKPGDKLSIADYLSADGVIKTSLVQRAFTKVDRRDFLPSELRGYANIDRPIDIGYGQTNSQPYTVAFMLELLGAKKGERILDVGSGSGWTTALLAHIVGSKGAVVGTERIPGLVEFGNDNLSKYDFDWATIEQAGEDFGNPEHAPYDRILVSASADEIPQSLVDQLKTDGIMVIPVLNSILRIKKGEHGVDSEDFPGFIFVPLIK